MEANKAQALQQYLRDKLNDVSYSIDSKEPNELVVFLDSQYREALWSGVTEFCNRPLEQPNINHIFETYIGLNGDKCYLHFIPNKGVENLDIFIKWKTN